jgi:hypothetical protein
VLAKIPLSYNTYYTTTNKNSLKFLRTCTSWALYTKHEEWLMHKDFQSRMWP